MKSQWKIKKKALGAELAGTPFESPFDRLTVLGNVEGLTLRGRSKGWPAALRRGKKSLPTSLYKREVTTWVRRWKGGQAR